MKEHLKSYFPERFDDTRSTWRRIIETPQEERIRFKCETMVAHVFSQSNELKLLRGAMRKYGCDFKLARHVSCESCSNCCGGYDPDTNQIVICHTQMLTKNKIMSLLMHEMIHMFDFCRAKFDFNNLEHVACSEIRAYNLSNCSLADRLQTANSHAGWFDFKKTHRFCVMDFAFKSVKAYSPETDSEKIWAIIDKVFPYCYNDLEPFGRRPTNSTHDFRQSYRERFYYGYV